MFFLHIFVKISTPSTPQLGPGPQLGGGCSPPTSIPVVLKIRLLWEADTDSDDSYHPPNVISNALKPKIKPGHHKKSTEKKHDKKSLKTKANTKTLTIENEIADDASNETSLKYEKVIKTLENTILKLQERIANKT